MMPLDRPSEFTPLPRTTASTRSPRRRASASRRSTTTPQPSPRTIPSADASNGLQRPSADSAPAASNTAVIPGDSNRFTPPTTAVEQSPACSALAAWCTATSDDEHAVSTVTLGPCAPSTYDSRFASRDADTPVADQASTVDRSASVRWPYSTDDRPTNTPQTRSAPSGMPASASASHVTSSSSRCCRSISSASRGLMPKNSASKPATSARNAPWRGTRDVSWPNAVQRSAGTVPTGQSPFRNSDQNSRADPDQGTAQRGDRRRRPHQRARHRLPALPLDVRHQRDRVARRQPAVRQRPVHVPLGDRAAQQLGQPLDQPPLPPPLVPAAHETASRATYQVWHAERLILPLVVRGTSPTPSSTRSCTASPCSADTADRTAVVTSRSSAGSASLARSASTTRSSRSAPVIAKAAVACRRTAGCPCSTVCSMSCG